MSSLRIAWLAVLAAIVLSSPVRAETGDLPAVRALLKARFPGKSWEGEPRIDSKFIRAMYPCLRFYSVTGGDEAPPGANIDEIQEGFRQRQKVREQTKIDAVVTVDATGKAALREDVNAGLAPVKSKVDVRIACLAIAELATAWLARPAPIVEADATVRIAAHKGGWKCELKDGPNITSNITFDANGRCTSADKRFTGPMPP